MGWCGYYWTLDHPGEPEVVTVGLLTDAICHAMGAERQDAARIAETVLCFFGFGDSTLDNVLEREERAMFYALESAGLMCQRSLPFSIHKSDDWRITTWRLSRGDIALSAARFHKAPVQEDPGMVYAALPRAVWDRHRDVEGDVGCVVAEGVRGGRELKDSGIPGTLRTRDPRRGLEPRNRTPAPLPRGEGTGEACRTDPAGLVPRPTDPALVPLGP